ncbi:MAG: hypothetical protein IH892_16755 [Planctomycetes bacterium]|nr:hypothetical protein [Planctomycetota bacterium]
MTEKKKTCFIIMPISTPAPLVEQYSYGVDHFQHVLDCLLTPSVEAAGYEAIPPKAEGADVIHAALIKNLEDPDLVLSDMSCLNPNVFFEFGIRTSLNKPVCVVKDDITKTVPFDTAILHYHEYKGSLNLWDSPQERQKLEKHLRTVEERSQGQNTLWKHFGLRTAAQPVPGETGTDAKIDYLTLQVESLRKEVGDNRPRSQADAIDAFPWGSGNPSAALTAITGLATGRYDINYTLVRGEHLGEFYGKPTPMLGKKNRELVARKIESNFHCAAEAIDNGIQTRTYQLRPDG